MYRVVIRTKTTEQMFYPPPATYIIGQEEPKQKAGPINTKYNFTDLGKFEFWSEGLEIALSIKETLEKYRFCGFKGVSQTLSTEHTILINEIEIE